MPLHLNYVWSLLEGSFFIMKNGHEIIEMGVSAPHTAFGWGYAPNPVFPSLFRVITCHLRNGKKRRKLLKNRFKLKVSKPVYAVFSKCKIAMKIKRQNFEKPFTAWITYPLNMLVCKLWYESPKKCGRRDHKHLGAYAPINDTFQSPISGCNSIFFLKTYCGMKYPPIKKTFMQPGKHKNLGADICVKAIFSKPKN